MISAYRLSLNYKGSYYRCFCVFCLLFCLIILLTNSCSVMEKTKIPVIRNRGEFLSASPGRVELIGFYRQADVRMKQTGDPVYRGNVFIELEENFKVLFFPLWFKESQRPADEINRFEGKLVRVICDIVKEAPESPDSSSNLVMPSIVSFDSIELISEK